MSNEEQQLQQIPSNGSDASEPFTPVSLPVQQGHLDFKWLRNSDPAEGFILNEPNSDSLSTIGRQVWNIDTTTQPLRIGEAIKTPTGTSIVWR